MKRQSMKRCFQKRGGCVLETASILDVPTPKFDKQLVKKNILTYLFRGTKHWSETGNDITSRTEFLNGCRMKPDGCINTHTYAQGSCLAWPFRPPALLPFPRLCKDWVQFPVDFAGISYATEDMTSSPEAQRQWISKDNGLEETMD